MNRYLIITIVLVLVGLLSAENRYFQVTANPKGSDILKAFIGNNAVPAGVTKLSITYVNGHFAGKQAGVYSNIPKIGTIKMRDGFVLTTGFAKDCIGPNDRTNTSGEHGWPGEVDLQAVAGTSIFDAAVVEIKFTTDKSVKGIQFDFAFGTEEFPEFVGKFNDVFICMYNGKNICKDSNGNLVSVNNAYFNIDNHQTPHKVDLEYDGFTCVLRTSVKVQPGDHVLKFAIGDAKDQRLDSGVFLSNFSFTYGGFEGMRPIKDVSIKKKITSYKKIYSNSQQTAIYDIRGRKIKQNKNLKKHKNGIYFLQKNGVVRKVMQ